MPVAGGLTPSATAGEARRANTRLRRDWELVVDVDEVLTAEGADPELVRARNSPALAVASQAIELGSTLLHPAAAWCLARIVGRRHEALVLEEPLGRLTGAVVAGHLCAARDVAAVVCTLGPELEAHVSGIFKDDPALALAVDAFGSVVMQRLAQAVRTQLASDMTEVGWQVGVALSPGTGWDLEAGQHQIFALVEAGLIGVSLQESALMRPKKSASFVLGLGPEVTAEGSPCDMCDLGENCRYRHLYEEGHGCELVT